jgi:hypothetical protein
MKKVFDQTVRDLYVLPLPIPIPIPTPPVQFRGSPPWPVLVLI